MANYAHLKAFSETANKHFMIRQLERWLTAANKLDEEDTEAEQDEEQARNSITPLRTLFTDVSQDWKELKDRLLGHIVLLPPIGCGVGEEGFMEDWAVVEIDASKVDATNFVGNVINLGATIPINNFTCWMCQGRHVE